MYKKRIYYGKYGFRNQNRSKNTIIVKNPVLTKNNIYFYKSEEKIGYIGNFHPISRVDDLGFLDILVRKNEKALQNLVLHHYYCNNL